jgi:uncharacterized protein YeaO (DUF488 family)
MLKIKRIYEQPAHGDGYRVLVDRLWPRGVSKEQAALDLWLKDVAPSTELRRWFAHDPAKWGGFMDRYRAELEGSAALGRLKELVAKHRHLTLLYGAKDEEHNEAVVLLELLS